MLSHRDFFVKYIMVSTWFLYIMRVSRKSASTRSRSCHSACSLTTMSNPSEISDEQYDNLERLLLNKTGATPLHERFRALFTLKSLKTDRAIKIISTGKCMRSGSSRDRLTLRRIRGRICFIEARASLLPWANKTCRGVTCA